MKLTQNRILFGSVIIGATIGLLCLLGAWAADSASEAELFSFGSLNGFATAGFGTIVASIRANGLRTVTRWIAAAFGLIILVLCLYHLAERWNL